MNYENKNVFPNHKKMINKKSVLRHVNHLVYYLADNCILFFSILKTYKNYDN